MRPEAFFWGYTGMPEALRETLLASGLPTVGATVAAIGNEADHGATLPRWLPSAARDMGFEGSVARVSGMNLEQALDAPGPYLIICSSASPAAVVAVACVVTRRGARILRPDGTEWVGTTGALCDATRRANRAERPVERLFDGLAGGRGALRRLEEREGVASTPFTVVRYELDAAHPILLQLREAGAARRAVGYLVATLFSLCATLGAAWTLGDAAVTGIIDLGRVAAWTMLAASTIPLEYVASVILGRLSLDFGAVIKKRLLEGALFIDEADVRRQGFALLLARLNEASVVEQTSPADLLSVVAPVVQVIAAGAFLWSGALAVALVPLLVAFVVGAAALAVTIHRRYDSFYEARLGLTEDLVDKIVGHRTRTVQDNAENWHDDEDVALERYARLSERYDRAWCVSVIYARTWLVLGGALLLVAFVFGAKTGALVVSGIGIFLAFRGLAAVLVTANHFAIWARVWQGVRPLFVAGRTRARPGRASVDAAVDGGPADAREPGRAPAAGGLDTVVSSLSFGYRNRARPVFSDAHLRIRPGERLLVEGPSGGGKTTFSKLLTGELRATSGTILVDGVDCFSVSAAEWRKRVAASPQFHENYLFTNTFGFNVDPRSLDGEMSWLANEVCSELGLDGLVAKMPSGSAQMLGETGWQLSHGERSRVFVARSLLQGAQLLIFDESFGALDPELPSRRRVRQATRKDARRDRPHVNGPPP